MCCCCCCLQPGAASYAAWCCALQPALLLLLAAWRCLCMRSAAAAAVGAVDCSLMLVQLCGGWGCCLQPAAVWLQLRCCRSPPGAATACSLNSLQSSAAVHPAVVVFPRPSWLSHVQAIVHLLVAAAVACSLRCLCMRPAAAPSAVVSAACRCCCCLRPGAASACSLLLLYAA